MKEQHSNTSRVPKIVNWAIPLYSVERMFYIRLSLNATKNHRQAATHQKFHFLYEKKTFDIRKKLDSTNIWNTNAKVQPTNSLEKRCARKCYRSDVLFGNGSAHIRIWSFFRLWISSHENINYRGSKWLKYAQKKYKFKNQLSETSFCVGQTITDTHALAQAMKSVVGSWLLFLQQLDN